MNLLSFTRTILMLGVGLTVTWLVADAQISGSGTTGVTEGSGRGNGSGGVMIGTGPDVRPASAEQPYGGAGQRNITIASTSGQNVSSAKGESQNSGKHSKKTSRHSRAATAPSASASPR